jgi:hypothetical protein
MATPTPIPATPTPHPGPQVVPPTPSERSEFVLKHLLKAVLGFRDDSPPLLALAYDGIETVHDLLSLSESRIDTLCYVTPDEPNRLPKRLQLGHRNKLQLFLRWRHHLEALQGGLMSLDDWMQVDQEDFDKYRISPAAAPPPSTLLSCSLAPLHQLLPNHPT